MLRLVELALFLAPFVVFALWRCRGGEGGPSVACSSSVPPACCAVLAGALIWLSQDDALPPGASLRPGAAAGWRGRLRPRRPAMSERAGPAHRAARFPGRAGAGRRAGGIAGGARGRRRGARRAGGPPRRRDRPRDAAHARAGDRALQAAGIRAVPTGLDHGTVTAVVGRARLRDHHAAPRRGDRRAARRGRLHRRLAGGRGTARLHHQRHVDDARPARCSTISAASPTCAPAVVRFVGDPATRIAEDYLRILRYFRFFARYGRRAGRPGSAGGDPRRRARSCPALRGAGLERAGAHPGGTRSARARSP